MEVGGDSSGSEGEDDDDDSDGNEIVADADDDDDNDDDEEDDEEEEEEEEEDAEGRSPDAFPLPNHSAALDLEAATPCLPGAVDEEDAAPMDVQKGTIHLAQAPSQQEISSARVAPTLSGARPHSPQASSNGSVLAPLKCSRG